MLKNDSLKLKLNSQSSFELCCCHWKTRQSVTDLEVQINLFAPMISHVFILSKESHFSIGNAQMEDQNSEIWLSDVGCPVQA